MVTDWIKRLEVNEIVAISGWGSEPTSYPVVKYQSLNNKFQVVRKSTVKPPQFQAMNWNRWYTRMDSTFDCARVVSLSNWTNHTIST